MRFWVRRCLEIVTEVKIHAPIPRVISVGAIVARPGIDVVVDIPVVTYKTVAVGKPQVAVHIQRTEKGPTPRPTSRAYCC